MKKVTLILCYLLLTSISLIGQSSFWESWLATTSIARNPNLSLDQTLDTCTVFLNQAQANRDSSLILCGYGLLFHTYMRQLDYPNASLALEKADRLAQTSKNDSWIGWVRHKQAVLAVRLLSFEQAKSLYMDAVKYCTMGQDSLCIALSLEQAASMYGKLNQFDSAALHFKRAEPLLSKYSTDFSLAAFHNNYANMLSLSGNPAEAIPWLEKSIAFYTKTENSNERLKAMNNLANAFRLLKKFDQARNLYKQCIVVNKSNNTTQNLISNYNGLFELEYESNNFKEAFFFLNEYYELRDSLVGARTKKEIADLELNYDNQKLELEVVKSEARVKEIERESERKLISLSLFLLITLLAGGFYWWRARLSRNRALQNQENLKSLTRVLLNKNKQLVELSTTIEEYKNTNANANISEFKSNIFDLRILTDSDYNTFLSSFENAYPGFIQKVRSAFPKISQSEERLFFFIKMKLNRKESASILGITSDSVKRTRNRLRKRLNIDSKIDLEDYIDKFGKPS